MGLELLVGKKVMAGWTPIPGGSQKKVQRMKMMLETDGIKPNPLRVCRGGGGEKTGRGTAAKKKPVERSTHRPTPGQSNVWPGKHCCGLDLDRDPPKHHSYHWGGDPAAPALRLRAGLVWPTLTGQAGSPCEAYCPAVTADPSVQHAA